MNEKYYIKVMMKDGEIDYLYDMNHLADYVYQHKYKIEHINVWKFNDIPIEEFNLIHIPITFVEKEF